MLKKYFHDIFPITIGLPDVEIDDKRVKKEIGEIFLSYLKDSKKLKRFFLSVPDWEIGEPYNIESGNMGNPLILFSDGWKKTDKYSISKSLLLLDDHIWGKPESSATETIMTNLKGPMLARIDRIDPFNFRIVRLNRIADKTTSLIKTAPLSETLYPFINSIQMLDKQKKDINNNQLTTREFVEQILEAAKKQFIFEKKYGGTIVEEAFGPSSKITKEITKIKNSFDEAIQALSIRRDSEEENIFWAFWKSLLYFYKDNELYINPNHIFYFTIPVYKKSDGKQVSPLCFILVVWDKLDNEFNLIDDEEFYDLIYLVISQWALLDNFKVARKSLRSQLLKSSIAAIMSRNGSHNIGSHVLAAVGTNSIDLPDDQVLFKYIQHRMDYIAQITTEIPGWTYSSLFVQDIMRRFFIQRHLLNNIAKSEGLEAYEYQKRNPNGGVTKNEWVNEVEAKLIIKVKNQKSTKYLISPYDNIEENLDVLSLAIPGGVIGQHAFFTILENIIRNSAKHNWSNRDRGENGPKNMEITIEYEDKKENDFVVYRIWDNVSDVFKGIDTENGQKVTLASESLPKNPLEECKGSYKLETLPLHQRLNCYLIKSFVDQNTGKLLKENWGLAEMKISVGYLNKRSLEEIGEDGPNVLFKQCESKYSGLIGAIGIKEAKVSKNNGDVYRLGFEFAVPKPKELLIIGDEIPGEAIRTKAKKKSVYFSGTDPESLDFEFVIFQKDQLGTLKADFEYWRYPHRLYCVCDDKQYYLNNNIVPINEDDFQKYIKKENWDGLKLLLYGRWIKKRYLGGDKKMSLYVNPAPGSGSGGDSGKSALRIFLDYYKDEIYEKYLAGGKSRFKSKETFEDYIKKALYGDYSLTSFDNLCEELEDKILDGNNNDIAEEYGKYLTAISDMMIKDDECIETLPDPNRHSAKKDSGKLWDDEKLFNTDENITLITNEIHEESATVKYKRHAKIDKAGSDGHEDYYEALSGSQNYFSMLENPPDEHYHKKKLAFQLVENALATILIIDERMANYYLGSDSEVKARLDRAGIYIISEFNYKNKVHTERKIEKEDPFDGNKKYSYIIIHQGILDKLKPNEQCTEEEKNNYLSGFIDYLKKHCDLLAVTSGRGQPDQLNREPEKSLKFLPFSNLESFILRPYHEKFLLVQALDQLIRERGEK